MRPGIGRNASCALGDCVTSHPEGPREVVVLDLFMYNTCTCMSLAEGSDVIVVAVFGCDSLYTCRCLN